MQCIDCLFIKGPWNSTTIGSLAVCTDNETATLLLQGGLVIHTVLSAQVGLVIHTRGLIIRIYIYALLSTIKDEWINFSTDCESSKGSRYRYSTNNETLVWLLKMETEL